MKRSAARLLHASNLAVGLTGAAWAYMRYVWSPGEAPDDPLLLMEWTGAHPFEPHARTLHLFAAPLLAFAVGVIWSSHIAPRLLKPWKRRRTGLALALLFSPMVMSGIALQTAGSPESREVWVWVHGLSSTVWALVYAAHLAAGLRPLGRRRHDGPQRGAGSSPPAHPGLDE